MQIFPLDYAPGTMINDVGFVIFSRLNVIIMNMELSQQKYGPEFCVKAIERNLIEGCKTWAAVPGINLRYDDGIMWLQSFVRFDLFNIVLRTRLAPGEAPERIARLIARQKEKNLPLTWYVFSSSSPDELGKYLEDAGFTFSGSTAGMALHLDELGEGFARPEDLEIREVENRDDLWKWVNIVISAFEFPNAIIPTWFEVQEAVGVGKDKRWRHFIGFRRGKAVAASSMFFGAGSINVANVATIPTERNQGIGTVMTKHILERARRLDFPLATLCATSMAEGVYRNLGFREYCRINLFTYSPD
ncbi:MAG: GNAT family N-acetyltransferase [Chlorobi bacterium]|nr:GNAT family N-acetyltransferase [Chlorobiota bacterium]